MDRQTFSIALNQLVDDVKLAAQRKRGKIHHDVNRQVPGPLFMVSGLRCKLPSLAM
jgi:hypothetical protein